MYKEHIKYLICIACKEELEYEKTFKSCFEEFGCQEIDIPKGHNGCDGRGN